MGVSSYTLRKCWDVDVNRYSRGLTPNLIKVTPSIAVSFYTFETVRDLLARWEDIDDDDHVV